MNDEIGSENWFEATEITLPDQRGVNSNRVLRAAFNGVDYSVDRPFAYWKQKFIVNWRNALRLCTGIPATISKEELL